jgi:hypothetical protein
MTLDINQIAGQCVLIPMDEGLFVVPVSRNYGVAMSALSVQDTDWNEYGVPFEEPSDSDSET